MFTFPNIPFSLCFHLVNVLITNSTLNSPQFFNTLLSCMVIKHMRQPINLICLNTFPRNFLICAHLGGLPLILAMQIAWELTLPLFWGNSLCFSLQLDHLFSNPISSLCLIPLVYLVFWFFRVFFRFIQLRQRETACVHTLGERAEGEGDRNISRLCAEFRAPWGT